MKRGSPEILDDIRRWEVVRQHPDSTDETRVQAQNQLARLRHELAEVLAKGEGPVAAERRRVARLQKQVERDRAKVRAEKLRAGKKRRRMEKVKQELGR